MLAALTIPVLGVPIETKSLKGLDSLLSIVQMPAGIPLPTLAIGKAVQLMQLLVQFLFYLINIQKSEKK